MLSVEIDILPKQETSHTCFYFPLCLEIRTGCTKVTQRWDNCEMTVNHSEYFVRQYAASPHSPSAKCRYASYVKGVRVTEVQNVNHNVYDDKGLCCFFWCMQPMQCVIFIVSNSNEPQLLVATCGSLGVCSTSVVGHGSSD